MTLLATLCVSCPFYVPQSSVRKLSGREKEKESERGTSYLIQSSLVDLMELDCPAGVVLPVGHCTTETTLVDCVSHSVVEAQMKTNG